MCRRYFVIGGGTAWSSRAGRVSGGVIVPAVSTVGGGSRATISHRAKVALFRTRGVRAAVFRLAVVQGAD